MNPLKELERCGQSPWLDLLQRSLIESGRLREMIERDGLKGLTSNPSIFEKAIGESDEYDEALKQFQSEGDHGVGQIYEHLAIDDIRAAADAFRQVYEQSRGRDGYVSLECSPYLANDAKATVDEALRLWSAVNRPNLMVKVPATPAGLPAIRQLLGQGLNINITLLFSVGVYEQVVEAYLGGLEDFARAGGDLSRVASVASFFVSRIDSAVDRQLEKSADRQAAAPLMGRIAIANAKRAYARYKALFSGPRWDALAASGAKTQRLLWASTSTKNKAYKDTLYAEALIGRDTVDTMPPATMDAFRDHGEARPDAIEQDFQCALDALRSLGALGISLDRITDELVEDGVRQFADAFDKLLGAVARRRRAQAEGEASIRFGSDELEEAYKAEMESWRRDGKIRRLWAGDKSLWSQTDEDRWLGWLRSVEQELASCSALEDFAQGVKAGGFTDVVLLGMGGSSLGPEVLAEVFGPQPGWPRLRILDSTDPAQIKALADGLDVTKTLFFVSSKSGGTLEPNIFMAYFFDRVAALMGEERAGAHFVAVTDPGSSLEQEAKRRHFWRVFHGAPSIGGRYSVLSEFGMAPAAAMGIDVRGLLESTQRMQRSCGPDAPPCGKSRRRARRRHGRGGQRLQARQGDDRRLAPARLLRRLA